MLLLRDRIVGIESHLQDIQKTTMQNRCREGAVIEAYKQKQNVTASGACCAGVFRLIYRARTKCSPWFAGGGV